MRDRAWLRRFLHLDARQEAEGINPDAIRLQEATVLAALDILHSEPGVLLADEVGMGKTYESLGLVACAFERSAPKVPRVLVVTPQRVLNQQWLDAARRFTEQGFYAFPDPDQTFRAVTHLHDLPGACARHPVVFAPVSIFTGVRIHNERGFLLQLWARQRDVDGRTLAAIIRRIKRDGTGVHRGQHLFGRHLDDAPKLPRAAFSRKRTDDGFRGLDDLLNEGLDAFEGKWEVRRALDRARFHMVQKLLPRFDLLVVDEAHKLKNPWSVRSQAISQALRRRYKKAVFLTATPFQLHTDELKRVFELFSSARTVRAGFQADVDDLFAAITEYRQAYGEFERLWRFVTPAQARALETWYAANRSYTTNSSCTGSCGIDAIDDTNVLELTRRILALRELKDQRVQPGFRQWTIRSLKPLKRERRDVQPRLIGVLSQTAVPLALYQRLMLERARSGRRTHVVAADINVASSFHAALSGELLNGSTDSSAVKAYQQLLRTVLRRVRTKHPKVLQVVDQALEAADRGEKTLIFSERNETVINVAKLLRGRWRKRHLRRWQRLVPGANRTAIFGRGSGGARVRGEFEKIADRFRGGQNELCLALRESYPHTLLVPDRPRARLPAALWKDLDTLVDEANAVLSQTLSSGTSAKRIDYRIARRAVDHAVSRWFERNEPDALDLFDGRSRQLLAPDYVQVGIDGIMDDDELEMIGKKDEPISWRLTRNTFETVLSPRRRSIWFPFRERLARFPVQRRIEIVDAVRHFLTQREVTFIVELLGRSGGLDASSAQIREALESWWAYPTCPWRRKVEELLDYLEMIAPSDQVNVLNDGLKNPAFVKHTLDGSSRSRLQYAFNAPFFPMILVGNQVMQEGLDLHRQCRRVIHHDLRWNPADLEQRTGRVDRHGSLSERRFRQIDISPTDAQIQVRYPLLARTIDPHQYQVVMEREKWLEFLLGRPPEIGIEDIDGDTPEPLPSDLADDLRVDLSPSKPRV